MAVVGQRPLGRFPKDRLAFVTHGTVMALFLGRVLEQPAAALWRQIQMTGLPMIAVVGLPNGPLEPFISVP